MALVVAITRKGFTIQAGDQISVVLPKKEGQYDLEGLSSTLYSLKKEFSGQDHLTLLSDPDVSYEILVKVMDASRERVITDGGEVHVIPLYPMVSIGEGGG